MKKLEIYQDTDSDYIVMIDGKDVYSGVSQDHVLETVSEFLEKVTYYS
jgi:hypothetical protein